MCLHRFIFKEDVDCSTAKPMCFSSSELEDLESSSSEGGAEGAESTSLR